MAKELYLYSPIYDFVAEGILSKIEESAGDDLIIRINSPGGDVMSGWGIIAKIKEHAGNIKVKVDGWAASMAADILLFADEVESLDVSKYMLHRADMYVENETDQAFLDGVNKDLRAKMKSKLDAAKFKEITGDSIEDMFDSKERKDYWFSAKEAKQIGLIKSIVKLTTASVSKELSTLNDNYYKVAAMAEQSKEPVKTEEPKTELTAKVEPKVENEFEKGIQAERERVAAWNVWADVDAEAVKAGIDSGKAISVKDAQEFMKKSASAEKLKSLENGGVKPSTAGSKPEDVATEGKTYVVNGKEVKLTAEQVNTGNHERKEAVERAKKSINPNYQRK